jgi:hypothetical protein
MNRARAVVVAAAVAALVAYVALRAAARPEPFTTLARPAAASAPPTAVAPTPDAAALRAALAALDRARAAAYADPVAADPDTWAARTCTCRAEDVRRLRRLAARGLALRGQRSTLLTFTLTRAGPVSAEALVTDRTSAYAAVDRRGHTVRRWPATPPRRWRIAFVLVSGRWLLGGIDRAP